MAFVWAVRSGQFDDMWTPAVRVLLDARTTSPVERAESAARSSSVVNHPHTR
jgi:nitrogen fixation-related uncharacterized protein